MEFVVIYVSFVFCVFDNSLHGFSALFVGFFVIYVGFAWNCFYLHGFKFVSSKSLLFMFFVCFLCVLVVYLHGF